MTAAGPALRTGSTRSGRPAARLAAVQALYQIDVTGVATELVIAEFLEHRFADLDGAESYAGADTQLFADIVRGAMARRAILDEAIAAALVAGWSLKRLDAVLRAILRAGAYELAGSPEVPARVAITQYVEVAHAFYEGKEPGFINGVLDHLARQMRGRELEETPRDTAQDAG